MHIVGSAGEVFSRVNARGFPVLWRSPAPPGSVRRRSTPLRHDGGDRELGGPTPSPASIIRFFTRCRTLPVAGVDRPFPHPAVFERIGVEAGCYVGGTSLVRRFSGPSFSRVETLRHLCEGICSRNFSGTEDVVRLLGWLGRIIIGPTFSSLCKLTGSEPRSAEAVEQTRV